MRVGYQGVGRAGVLLMLASIPWFSCLGQYIVDGSLGSERKTTQTSDGPLTLEYRGVYEDGKLRYPISVRVSYAGTLNGSASKVKVDYELDVRGRSGDNFYLDNNGDLSYNCWGLANCGLRVQGAASTQGAKGPTVVAQFEGVVYSAFNRKFRAWLVSSQTTFLGADTSQLAGLTLRFDSDAGTHHLGGTRDALKTLPAKAAFFQIGPDYRLIYAARPSVDGVTAEMRRLLAVDLPSVGTVVTGAVQPDVTSRLYAILHTSEGDITALLHEQEAPITVRNFYDLAKGLKEWTDSNTGNRVKRPFYNGLTFHRVIPKFMIQELPYGMKGH